jgi:hypothetical protein
VIKGLEFISISKPFDFFKKRAWTPNGRPFGVNGPDHACSGTVRSAFIFKRTINSWGVAMGSTRKLATMSPDQDEEEKRERRAEAERRRFSYSAYIPERRTGRKRRKEKEANKSVDGLKGQDSDE